MALLKPEVLDSALEFHRSFSFLYMLPVNRASVKVKSKRRDVPKGQLGLKCFPVWRRQIEAPWHCKGFSDEVKAHRRLFLISNTRIHVLIQLGLWGIAPGLHLWLVLKHIPNQVYKLWTCFTIVLLYLDICIYTKRLRWALWANTLIKLWVSNFAFHSHLWFS